MSVREAIIGTRRELVMALMGNLADAIDRTENDAARAAMSRQLRELRDEIELIDLAANGDAIGTAADIEDAEWPAS